MANKLKIYTLDFQIKVDNVVNLSCASRGALIDADIVIIDPEGIAANLLSSDDYHETESYQGRPVLYEDYSHQIIQIFERRNRELNMLLQNGRTIFCFLKPEYSVNVIKDVTQTFKGRTTINQRSVNTVTNYTILPYFPPIIEGSGKEVAILKTNFDILLLPLKESMYYEAYVAEPVKGSTVIATTAATNNPVGLILPIKNGNIVFLPTLRKTVKDSQLLNFFINFSKVIICKSGVTPPPEWCVKFTVPGEKSRMEEITGTEQEIEQIKSKLAKEVDKLSEIQKWKGLLFEQGKPLEDLVKSSLELIGFSVSKFRDKSMEHDIILEATEGRALGEIEGKDNSAINVDKFRQLSSNLDEDFERNGKYSKGVLIGNGYRLIDPNTSRPCQFTEKVIEGAKSKKFALLTTEELFKAVVYSLESEDDLEFKQSCRKKIFEISGEIIKFVFPQKEGISGEHNT